MYQLIFLTQKFNPELVEKYMIGEDKNELNMLVYAHGIIMMKALGTLTIGWEQIREMIVNAYDQFQVS